MDEKIRKILREILIDFNDCEGTDIIKDGLMDSIDFLEVVSAIEDEFHVEIAAEEMISDNFRSVEKIKELILRS